VPTVKEVWFEGGEPFLVYPLLLEGIRLAHEHGFTTGVVSNAYWAESVEDAELWLRPFAELRLGTLLLSDDPYHHGDRDPSPASLAREAANRLGLGGGEICLPPPDRLDGVRFRGRAADRLTEGLPSAPWREMTSCPDEDLRDPERVHVDPFGLVHGCQGILLGDLTRESLADLLARDEPDRDPIRGPLLRGGPAALVEEHGLEPPEPVVSACHLCYLARQELRERFPERLGPAGVYGATS
jgi:hypothetical protein